MRRNKILESIRKSWGKPIDKYRNFDLISFYHNNIKEKFKKEDLIDDETWDDLNFNDIFSIIDRNISPIGQQYLYHSLHKYESSSEIHDRYHDLSEFLLNNDDVRESIQIILNNLSNSDTYFISPLIFGDLPKRPKYYPIFFILSYFALFSIPLIFIHGSFFFLLLGIFLINLIVNHYFSNNISKYFIGFSSLNLMFITALKFSKLDNANIKEINFLRSHKKSIKTLNKKIGSLVLNKASTNEMLSGIIEYLNIYFLYDLKKYSISVGLLQKYQSEIQKIFTNIGLIDTTISIASYKSVQKHICKPEFISKRQLSFENICHPLIVDPVPNTLSEFDKSVLITGSNMAGKTTFMKTIGVNIILSQTINLCLSDSARIPKLRIKSAIRREENLEDSKSYFFSEVEAINTFMQLSKKNNNYLFLIDEIFRGTNTIERLSASAAVLGYLNENNLVYVTTHDIELRELLESQFEMIHFSEHVEGTKYYFDYKLHFGTLFSGNAIKLLELKNYPSEVILLANELKEKISKTTISLK